MKNLNIREKLFFISFSLLLITLFLLSFNFSTFADRLALYCIPAYLLQ